MKKHPQNQFSTLSTIVIAGICGLLGNPAPAQRIPTFLETVQETPGLLSKLAESIPGCFARLARNSANLKDINQEHQQWLDIIQEHEEHQQWLESIKDSKEKLNQDLLDAMADNNEGGIILALYAGADRKHYITDSNLLNSSAMMQSAKNGHLYVLGYLLEEDGLQCPPH